MGVTVSPPAIRVTNTAAVLVTATLPAFAQPGRRIDTTVAAIGDAQNLQGGILRAHIAPRRRRAGLCGRSRPGHHRRILQRTRRSRPDVNHPTVGRAPTGRPSSDPAPSVRPAAPVRLQLDAVRLHDLHPDRRSIGKRFSGAGKGRSAGLVTVAIPPEYAARTTDSSPSWRASRWRPTVRRAWSSTSGPAPSCSARRCGSRRSRSSTAT